MAAYTVNVQPWLQMKDCAKKRDINLIAQFGLYKCMSEWCIFATNVIESWENHMKEHISLLDTLSKKQLINNDDHQFIVGLNRFHECPYCDSESLTEDHAMEHRRSNIQCAFCFYRTNEMDNMVLHMETYHSNADREILLYNVYRKFQQLDEEILRDGCEQYVTKIICGRGKVHQIENTVVCQTIRPF